MRRVNGWLLPESPDDDDLAPYVRVQVSDLNASEPFMLLIDTGSNVTVLMPQEAYRLFGDAYFGLDFDDASESMLIEGVGGAYRSLPFDMLLAVEDEHFDLVRIERRIWIAEPDPDFPSDTGNWDLPSIFGRDSIRPGDSELSYVHGTVTLIRPDDE